MDGGDVMLIIDHVDKRLAETEDRLMGVIREGREAHTREHSEQQSYCVARMTPLQDDLATRQRTRLDRQAQVRPLVRIAEWATDHWLVAVAIVSAWILVLTWIGHVVHG